MISHADDLSFDRRLLWVALLLTQALLASCDSTPDQRPESKVDSPSTQPARDPLAFTRGVALEIPEYDQAAERWAKTSQPFCRPRIQSAARWLLVETYSANEDSVGFALLREEVGGLVVYTNWIVERDEDQRPRGLDHGDKAYRYEIPVDCLPENEEASFGILGDHSVNDGVTVRYCSSIGSEVYFYGYDLPSEPQNPWDPKDPSDESLYQALLVAVRPLFSTELSSPLEEHEFPF